MSELAKWIVIGFARCWVIRQVVEAAGLPAVQTKDDAAKLHAAAPFMPAELWSYIGKSGTPVRAFVSAQWPKLHAYLDLNHGCPEKLARAIPQVERLKSAESRMPVRRTADEAREINKSRQQLRRVTTANMAARAQQLSTQRGAWKVCK